MALQKDYTHKGITGNYWRIENVSYNFRLEKTVVVLSLYASSEVRDSSVDNVLYNPQSAIFLDGLIFGDDGDPRPALYEALKTVTIGLPSETVEQAVEGGEEGETETIVTPFFADAVDV